MEAGRSRSDDRAQARRQVELLLRGKSGDAKIAETALKEAGFVDVQNLGDTFSRRRSQVGDHARARQRRRELAAARAHEGRAEVVVVAVHDTSPSSAWHDASRTADRRRVEDREARRRAGGGGGRSRCRSRRGSSAPAGKSHAVVGLPAVRQAGRHALGQRGRISLTTRARRRPSACAASSPSLRTRRAGARACAARRAARRRAAPRRASGWRRTRRRGRGARRGRGRCGAATRCTPRRSRAPRARRARGRPHVIGGAARARRADERQVVALGEREQRRLPLLRVRVADERDGRAAAPALHARAALARVSGQSRREVRASPGLARSRTDASARLSKPLGGRRNGIVRTATATDVASPARTTRRAGARRHARKRIGCSQSL